MTRSSTSSSNDAPSRGTGAGSGPPWAALCAVLLLLAFDQVALGPSGPWGAFRASVPFMNSSYFVAHEQRMLQVYHDAARKAAEMPVRIVVLGSSRAMAGVREGQLKRALGDVRVIKFARPGLEPFQQRGLVDEVLSLEPRVVVLTLSEFDTHRPLRLEPVVARAAGSWAGLTDLFAATDAAFAWQNRDSLYRLVAAELLHAYRYREVLGEVGGFEWRRFAQGPRLVAPSPPMLAGRARVALFDAEPRLVPDALRERVLRVFPDFEDTSFVSGAQVDMIAETAGGDHANVQRELLRRTLAALRLAGVEVVIAEAPLHPIAAELYDTSLREEFLAFAHELEASLGVAFVPLEESGPYESSDFGELIHLDESGGRKLTHGIATAVRERLGADPATD